MTYCFETTCVNVPSHLAYELHEMEDRAREVSYETIRRNLGTAALSREFPQYIWGPRKKKGIRMKHDPYVQYYKSYFRGQRCLGVNWSAIDHIWTQRAA